MSKHSYAVFEPVGFTEPIPGLRRRPAAARAAPIVEPIEIGESRWSATLPPDEAEAREARPAARGRAAPLATGVVLLAMAGAGWAMLQASNPPALETPPLAELSVPPTPGDASTPQQGAPAIQAVTAVPEAATEQVAQAAPTQAASDQPATKAARPDPMPANSASATPAAPSQTAAVRPGQGDLLKTLPAPAAGQESPPNSTMLPDLPSAMPTSPLASEVAASSPVEAKPADSKPANTKPESKPEAPAATAPQPPASTASASAG